MPATVVAVMRLVVTIGSALALDCHGRLIVIDVELPRATGDIGNRVVVA